MDGIEEIAEDEILLRRIPPSTANEQSTTRRADGTGERASSFRLQTRGGEQGLSCSRLRQTSPNALLEQLRKQGTTPAGWGVCRIFVRDLVRLGLTVEHKPTEDDPGHCEIKGPIPLDYPNKTSSKLAKQTRMLTAEEIANLKAGDQID